MGAKRYTLHAVKIGTTVLAGTASQRATPNGEVEIPVTDGGPYPTVAATLRKVRGFEFVTHDIPGIIGAVTLLAKDISTISGGVILISADQGPVARASGTTHLLRTVTAGIIAITAIPADDGRLSQATVQVIPISSDGFTDPVDKATGALPAITTPWGQAFTLGGVNINSTLLSSVKTWRLNLGFQFFQDTDNGKPFVQFASVQQEAPTVDIEHADDAYDAPAVLTDATMFLRSIATGGGPEADVELAHIAFGVAGGVVNDTDVSWNYAATKGLRIDTRKDGATGIVTYTADQAIA